MQCTHKLSTLTENAVRSQWTLKHINNHENGLVQNKSVSVYNKYKIPQSSAQKTAKAQSVSPDRKKTRNDIGNQNTYKVLAVE